MQTVYRGVFPLSFQFAGYYGGVLGMDALIPEDQRTYVTSSALTLGQTFWGLGTTHYIYIYWGY